MLLCAKRYSITNSIVEGFRNFPEWQVEVLDYEDFFNKKINRFVSKLESLPNKIKGIWKDHYLDHINKMYIKFYNQYDPDLIFIYNNQYLYPETLKLFKNKSKIAFILGDNPLYTPTSYYNLDILFRADYIICPDTFWKQQLDMLGIKHIHFDCFSFDSSIYYPLNPSEQDISRYKSDIVYVGSAHISNWGYKRFHFLSQFQALDLKAYMNGNGYQRRWKPFFPELQNKVIPHDRYDSSFNNMVYNCSKVSPVELVPSLFNGVHVRIFDILGAGIFPLCEYSNDLDIVFSGLDFPVIHNYSKASQIAHDIINDDNYRIGIVTRLRSEIIEKYKPSKVIGRLLDYVNFQSVEKH